VALCARQKLPAKPEKFGTEALAFQVQRPLQGHPRMHFGVENCCTSLGLNKGNLLRVSGGISNI